MVGKFLKCIFQKKKSIVQRTKLLQYYLIVRNLKLSRLPLSHQPPISCSLFAFPTSLSRGHHLLRSRFYIFLIPYNSTVSFWWFHLQNREDGTVPGSFGTKHIVCCEGCNKHDVKQYRGIAFINFHACCVMHNHAEPTKERHNFSIKYLCSVETQLAWPGCIIMSYK